MKDNTVYLLYNTNASDIKLQKQPVKSGSFDWEYVDKDKFTIMYNPEDVRKSTEIKIHSKTKLRVRPKSAGEVMMQPKINAEGILIKRSISLSNIEDFFLNRRIPLIKPLFSEKEILKLQLRQKQCRKKPTGSEPEKSYLQNFDVEDKDLRKYKGLYPESEEEKSKDKARDETSPLISTKIKSKEDEKRPEDKRRKEIKEGKQPKTPASGKSRHEEKKFKKDLSFDKSKRNTEKGKKNEKQGASKKESIGISKKEKQGATDKEKTKSERSPKGEQNSEKNKAKTSLESELKTTKSDSKTKSQSKPLKSKEKTKSEEKISGEDMKHEDSDKVGSKESSKKTSKQKLKSELSEKDRLSKGASKHSKDRTSQGKKSDNKSDKSESGKSMKMSDSSKKRKEKEDQDMKDKLVKMKSQSEDSQEGKTVTDKGDKKSKPGAASERTSGPSAKEKSLKIEPEDKPQKAFVGKSVKFPNVFQHIIHYVLSNPLFVNLGWTLSPSDRAQLQVVTFRTVPTTPHTYCFRERTEEEIKYYSKTLERVAFHFRVDGTGEIFYPSGVPAATITNHSTGMRLILYSDPKNDPLISDSFKSNILAIFDSFGNGVVYDLQGKKLLNFNQLEGIFCSPNRQSPYKWQWCDYKILDKKRLKALLRYMAKEQKQPAPTKKSAPSNVSSPKKPKPEEKKSDVDEAYEQILAELPYPVPQKTKTKSENQVWGFKPITLKINSEMALRINGQDDITVSFSSNQIFLRIDLGVKIDPDVVERIEALAPTRVSDVPCVFDGLLEPTQSLQELTAGSKKFSSKT